MVLYQEFDLSRLHFHRAIRFERSYKHIARTDLLLDRQCGPTVASPVSCKHLKVAKSESVSFVVLKESHQIDGFHEAFHMSIDSLENKQRLSIGNFTECLTVVFSLLLRSGQLGQ